jgi:hypothetical protein
LQDEDFKQIIGVAKEAFDTMADILGSAYAEKHKRRGRHTKPSIQDQLFMSLKYWRNTLPKKSWHTSSGLHKNSGTPHKKPRDGELSAGEKQENRGIFRGRILIEHINAKIKVFKITSNKYRNRRKRFGLRMPLICGLINFELEN